MRLFRAFSVLLLVSSYGFAATPDRIAGAIDSSQTVRLSKSLHPKAQPQYDQGPVDPQLKLSYVTLLTSPSPSQQRALNKLLADQQNPASPNYHQWLTPEQYADRFGLSQNDIAKMTAWLKGQGFSVVKVARGRNSIIVSGTAAEFESAFQTEIHRYQVDGEFHVANATPLRVPAAWSGIVTGVRGLHNFLLKPMDIRRILGLHPFYYDSTFNILIAPGDVATIYDIGPLYSGGFDGTGQKLAVVGQTDIYPDDINDFRTGFGLSAVSGCTVDPTSGVVTACNTTNFKYVLDTNVTDPLAPSTCGDLSEADLDIEWSGATARNAQIIYVNSPAVFDASCTTQLNNGGVENALSVAIQGNVAPVVSMSYGICEAFAGNDETELQQANSQGMTIVNSTGDVGAAGCDFSPPNTTRPFQPAVGGQAVSYPASSPEVTGVGGTHIPLSEFTMQYWGTTNGPNDGTALSYVPEVGWNDDTEFALYCQAHASDPFCSQGGSTKRTGWVALTSSATAATVQKDIWINSGGGGPSNCFAETAQGVCTAGFQQPAWQTVTIPGQASARFVPDVSLMASADFPGYIFCTQLTELGIPTSIPVSSCVNGINSSVDNYFSIVGGTSVSAPVFAGMIAILNQYLGNANGMGNANPNLYHIATYNQTAFHQVTTGDNIVSCQPHTPSIQPTALQCPAAVAPATAGVVGYKAANTDPATGYNLVNGLGSVDASNLATAWGELLTASATSLSRSAASIVEGQSETLTITVTPSSASGVVSLYNNGSTSALTTVTVSGGTGTFSTTSLPIGTNSMVGKYNGTNASSTSAAVVVTVVAPDFTWGANSPKLHQVGAGQTSLDYTFTAVPMTPSGSPKFTTAVTFSCTAFDPSDPTLTSSSCTFNPPSITAGTTVSTPVKVSITTKGPFTGSGPFIHHRADKRSPWLPLALPIAGIILVGLVGRRVSKHSVVAGLCVSLALIGLLIACGGGGSTPVSVSISPGTASLFPNNAADAWPSSTQAFSSNVSNTTNTAVTWSISPSTAGSIDASGNYTAPTVAPGLPSTVTVTATSQADSSKTGTARITLKPATVPGTFNVTVTASEASTSKQDTVALTVQ